MSLTIPDRLAQHCESTTERKAWLERLPGAVRELKRRWRLTLERPFDSREASCAWVAPAALPNGTSAVLKLAVPHMEGQHEIAGLRFWDGNPTVRLIEADENLGAMLLERCEPGTPLRARPETEQNRVIAGLLRQLWRLPPQPHSFRPLSDLMASWAQETLADAKHWPDAVIVRDGLRLFDELPLNATEEAVLATDLHAGNVLKAQREPWLVIDPKPFFGDVAYDATQHLFNCAARLRSDPDETVRRFSDLLDVDRERVRLWMFARAAAEPRDDWGNDEWLSLTRAVAP